jgi:hypothetical protein
LLEENGLDIFAEGDVAGNDGQFPVNGLKQGGLAHAVIPLEHDLVALSRETGGKMGTPP